MLQRHTPWILALLALSLVAAGLPAQAPEPPAGGEPPAPGPEQAPPEEEQSDPAAGMEKGSPGRPGGGPGDPGEIPQLHVSVLDSFGRPIEKAEIAALPLDGDGEAVEMEVTGGHAMLELAGTYLLTIRAVGFMGWTGEVTVPGEPIQVRLAVASGLVGRVRDDTHVAIPGVKLVLTPVGREAAPSILYSDDKGNFYLEGVEPGSYSLHAEKEGYFPWSQQRLDLSAGRTVRADFLLRRPAELSVFVRGRDGSGVPGAEVFLLELDPPVGMRAPGGSVPPVEVRAVTNGKGVALLAPLPRRQMMRVGVRHPDYASRSIKLSLREKRTYREIGLLKGGTLRITMMDRSETPVEGVAVRFASFGAGDLDMVERPGRTGTDGLVVLKNLPAGQYTLWFEAAGYTPITMDGVRVDMGREVKFSVEIARGLGIRGKVVREDGSLVDGARVSAVFLAGGRRRVEECVTGESGVFQLEGLPAGPVEIRVLVDGYPPYDLSGVPAGTTDLIVRLVPFAKEGEGG